MDEKEKTMNAAKKFHTRMRIWEFADKFVVEPLDSIADSYLSISRSDGSMASIGEIPHCDTFHSPKVCTIFGVIGMLRLLVGSYLIVVAECECVGSYLGHDIFKVLSLQILPCNHSLNNSSAEQKRLESELSLLLSAAERTSGLYFSYDVNLTLCAQRLHDLGEESKLLPLWRQVDPRFMWNNYILEALIENKMDRYLLPVIQGSYQSFQAAVRTKIVDVTLIARRCTRRTGTRMWRRGADSDGYVANFVESEQILKSNGFQASFIQVRGSMPFLWEQIVDLTYKPSFEIVRPEDAARVAEHHFSDLAKNYRSVLAVDLVNKHGAEGRLSEKISNVVQPILSDNIRYVHFDFHKICGHIHFERLSILYDQMEDYLKNHKYFLLKMNGEKVEQQTGAVRTNCIDCLDRTNVTQSMIGRKMLERQLNQIGVFNIWANHGDDISIQYSGTPALKGDFVRYSINEALVAAVEIDESFDFSPTICESPEVRQQLCLDDNSKLGVFLSLNVIIFTFNNYMTDVIYVKMDIELCGNRTFQGIVNDGWNALARYYLNNFEDGIKQDAIDLVQGHYIVSTSRDLASQAQPKGLDAYANMKLASEIVLTGVIFAVISLRRARNDWRHLLFSLVWAGLTLGVGAFVRANGKKITNRLRLLKSRH